MTDVFGPIKRSEIMSRIRGKGNATTELAMAAAFKRAGIKGWRRHVAIRLVLGPRVALREGGTHLVVRPDFVFRREQVAVFVDGCFWHRCPLHCKIPANNREFWEQKLSRNADRDRFVDRELRKAGWRVWRVWEHSLKNWSRDGRLAHRSEP